MATRLSYQLFTSCTAVKHETFAFEFITLDVLATKARQGQVMKKQKDVFITDSSVLMFETQSARISIVRFTHVRVIVLTADTMFTQLYGTVHVLCTCCCMSRECVWHHTGHLCLIYAGRERRPRLKGLSSLGEDFSAPLSSLIFIMASSCS